MHPQGEQVGCQREQGGGYLGVLERRYGAVAHGGDAGHAHYESEGDGDGGGAPQAAVQRPRAFHRIDPLPHTGMKGVGSDDADNQHDGKEVAVGAGQGKGAGRRGVRPDAAPGNYNRRHDDQQQQGGHQYPELDAVGIDGHPQAAIGGVGNYHQAHRHRRGPRGSAGEDAHRRRDGGHLRRDEYADDEYDDHENGHERRHAEAVPDIFGNGMAVGHHLADAGADEHKHHRNAGHAQGVADQGHDAEVGAGFAGAQQHPSAEH